MNTGSSPPQGGEQPKIYVYLLTFKNGKCYVGYSMNPKQRLRQHASEKRRGPLPHAIVKYGLPELTILHTVETVEEASYLEVEEIAVRKTQAPLGYNLTQGGEGVVGASPEQRAEWARKSQESYKKNTTPKQRSQRGKSARAAWTETSMRGMKEAKTTPEARHQSAKNLKKSVAKMTPKQKAAKNKKHRQKWKDPEFREKMLHAQRKGTAEMADEAKEQKRLKMSESMKKRWADPEYRERRRKALADPEVRKKMAVAGGKAAAALTPEGRQRKVEGSRKSANKRWSERRKSGDKTKIGRKK